ncbi:thiosulfate sulfurtransferase/rhodanese-like domain-containing protein 3 [Clarias gariepinus]|uniref:thiosulfate sulfurtransferase/rhodanese-like domain-containing protein 3 n=1 Tax=Clarias gariepinus TaxID=13013 RepID=UPI00234C73EF|nr:thiosulfate sulfurtransferase/rhodanese-like domain-containing protein 3 [Clarias gariepinus]
MSLNACCRLTRCVLRAVGNRNGAVMAGLAARARYAGHHATVRTAPWTRRFSSADQAVGVVSYEQVKKLLLERTGVLIDVREPWELREYGGIPGSINVPLGQLQEALQLKPEEFKEKYGGAMPAISDCVVFTCLAGVRAQKALEAARSLRYSNAQCYAGGWQDWAKHEILQSKA